MRTLSEEEFHTALREKSDYTGGYWRRLDETMSYSGIGWGGPFFLFNHQELNEGVSGISKRILKSPRSYLDEHKHAYQISGVLGENLRIVDDILDGDGCEPVEDREKFLDNYIDAVGTGEKQTVIETEEEEIAYSAGSILHEILSQDENVLENAINNFQNMADLVETEDKSQRETYIQYVDAAGREYGRLLINSLELIDYVNVSEEDLKFAGDYGFATQVADDKFDDDIGLEREILDEIYQESLENLSSHNGIVPTVIPFAGEKAPSIYNVLIEVNDRFVEEN